MSGTIAPCYWIADLFSSAELLTGVAIVLLAKRLAQTVQYSAEIATRAWLQVAVISCACLCVSEECSFGAGYMSCYAVSLSCNPSFEEATKRRLPRFGISAHDGDTGGRESESRRFSHPGSLCFWRSSAGRELRAGRGALPCGTAISGRLHPCKC